MDVRRKLLSRDRDVDIWRVDGHTIRDTIDVEFTNGHHHFTRRYVPRGEIWLDREAPGSLEWPFWAVHQLAELAAMAAGKPYLTALRIGNRAERAERRAAGRTPGPLRRRSIGGAADHAVWLVSGHAVRHERDLDFTLGGHGLRYPFIPDGEIWIDDAVAPGERAAILHHEVVEIVHMKRGLDYPAAHSRASRAERRFRKEGQRAKV